jgi:predicted metalloendopeptidase
MYRLANVTLNDAETVLVYQIDYLNNLSLILNQYPARTIQNYFIMRFLWVLIGYMPKKYRAITQELVQALQGTITEKKRSITCNKFVNVVMGFAVSRPYLKKYFDDDARRQVRIVMHGMFFIMEWSSYSPWKWLVIFAMLLLI